MTGKLVNLGGVRYSPSGIPHYKVILEHRSTQLEAGARRLVTCRIAVQCSGEPLVSTVNQLQLGSVVSVQGFLSMPARIAAHAEIPEMVLHAQTVSLL